MEDLTFEKMSKILKEIKNMNLILENINQNIIGVNEKIDILYSSDILSKKILNNHEHRIYDLEKM